MHRRYRLDYIYNDNLKIITRINEIYTDTLLEDLLQLIMQEELDVRIARRRRTDWIENIKELTPISHFSAATYAECKRKVDIAAVVIDLQRF